MNIVKTNGLIAAPFTPMHLDGSLALDRIPRYLQWLKHTGVGGAFVCGTTGEVASLSCDERREIARAWMQAAPSGFSIIVHVGHTCLENCRGLAAHAQEIGAAAVSCFAPYFFRPRNTTELADWCAAVAAAAPGLPFYYYHIPSMTGLNLPMADFMPLAAAKIPNFAGIKYTYEDLEDYAKCVRFAESRYDVLFGRDELLLSALQLGARGAVGSTYNFAAPLYRAIITAHESGDLAAAKVGQTGAVAMIDSCVNAGGHPIAAFKSLMARLGVDCGPTRPPLANPTSAQADA
ncbi:MAG: dihydrodipicolinate synthase family protein, partial [Cephaloticoccus sp.]